MNTHKLGCVYTFPGVSTIGADHGLDGCDKNIDSGFRFWRDVGGWDCPAARQEMYDSSQHNLRDRETCLRCGRTIEDISAEIAWRKTVSKQQWIESNRNPSNPTYKEDL